MVIPDDAPAVLPPSASPTSNVFRPTRFDNATARAVEQVRESLQAFNATSPNCCMLPSSLHERSLCLMVSDGRLRGRCGCGGGRYGCCDRRRQLDSISPAHTTPQVSVFTLLFLNSVHVTLVGGSAILMRLAVESQPGPIPPLRRSPRHRANNALHTGRLHGRLLAAWPPGRLAAWPPGRLSRTTAGMYCMFESLAASMVFAVGCRCEQYTSGRGNEREFEKSDGVCRETTRSRWRRKRYGSSTGRSTPLRCGERLVDRSVL
jgi:hypothetical protein